MVRWFATAALATTTLAAIPAGAAPFTANYVFGDSLSDRGNLAEAIGHNFPSPPFVHDSFTDGPTAVQVLAQHLGLTADPSLYPTNFVDANKLGLVSGTNYAVAGGTAGNRVVGTQIVEGVPGGNLPTQIGAYLTLSGGHASTSALYTVFIGGNDVRTAAHTGDATFVTEGVQTELAGIQALESAGATNLLVVNVPDVGRIPEFTQGYPSQASTATADTVAYNQALASGLSALMSPSITLKLFDFYTLDNTLLGATNPLGFTNLTDPCYLNTGAGISSAPAPLQINPACGAIDPATGQAANIDRFAFWDAIHPTAPIQAALGDALYATVVPEPGSLLLLGAGLAGLIARRRAGST